ncbi:MAG: 50S ribosomal protein L35 [Elusimicrobiota bacterium]
MPKLKTHSGAKKRFRFTGTGRIKYKKAGLRHLLTGMSPGRGRRLRKSALLGKTEERMIRRLLAH